MTRRQQWAMWVTIFVLVWMVATVGGLLLFAPQRDFGVYDRDRGQQTDQCVAGQCPRPTEGGNR